ncbi:hypothetical protein BCR44DRAFT_129392 [Catenaria anguillulae PL171]|uniref:U6 snRNA-associated Sm-like protein LSm1 n=1 Tax=Catenaria anguillulae PL171 TaxID=765915 RepID=A0A1Y2HUF6_9FUNG|nr:hypothetical protein BCR44DRAFT_129392 [Catenaria anguillulae PL171]
MSGGGGGGGSSHNYNQSQGRGYQQQQHNQYQRSNNNNNSFYNKSGAGGNASATDLAQALLPPGSAALLDLIDKRVLVLLRDGRLLVGILRSYDHFANLVFQDTVERIAAGDVFGGIDRGVFVVRGENVVMLGEVDGDVEDALPMREVPVEEALAMQRVELDIRRAKEAVEHPALHRGGFCVDFDPNDMY